MGEKRDEVVSMKPVKLISVPGPVESGIIAEMLQKEGIQCYIRPLESGGYMKLYMGYSVFGEEIYVDEQDYQAAKEIAALFETDGQERQAHPPRKVGKSAWLLAVLVGVVLVLPFVIQLFGYF